MARLVEGADSSEDNPVEIGEIFTGFANYGLDPDEEFLIIAGNPGDTVKITLLPDIFAMGSQAFSRRSFPPPG